MNCLLFDVGNTHTHLGLANARRVIRRTDIPTAAWFDGSAAKGVARFVEDSNLQSAVACSVVPKATVRLRRLVKQTWGWPCLELTPKTIRGVGIDYPHPTTIGPDRLANAVAAKNRFGAPVVVVDFGTAVTFDVVNDAGDYVGGIIAPGLTMMTSYLHEKTALLPEIKIREVKSAIGKSTEHAMLVGAVQGYRGMVRELIRCLKSELQARHLPVVATGGYARLIAAGVPEIQAVDRLLTLEGLRLTWLFHCRSAA